MASLLVALLLMVYSNASFEDSSFKLPVYYTAKAQYSITGCVVGLCSILTNPDGSIEYTLPNVGLSIVPSAPMSLPGYNPTEQLDYAEFGG